MTKNPLYTVKLTESAQKEFKALGADVKKQAKTQLKKLYTSPQLGIPLGNKAGYDCTGCYKLEFYKKKQYRIVYSWKDDTVVVEVISINKRDKLKVYSIVAKWLSENK